MDPARDDLPRSTLSSTWDAVKLWFASAGSFLGTIVSLLPPLPKLLVTLVILTVAGYADFWWSILAFCSGEFAGRRGARAAIILACLTLLLPWAVVVVVQAPPTQLDLSISFEASFLGSCFVFLKALAGFVTAALVVIVHLLNGVLAVMTRAPLVGLFGLLVTLVVIR